MKENSIDVEVVPVEVVRCPRCGARNRLVKQERHVGYKCGGCWTPLENPFVRFSLIKRCFQGVARGNSSRLVGKFIGSLVIAIAVFAILQHHEQQPARGLDAGLVVPPRVVTIDSQPSPLASRSLPSPKSELTTPVSPGTSPLFSRSRSVPPLETPAAPPRSLENGTILEDVINAGHSKFTVENGTDRDAVVKLIDQTQGQTVVAIYVTAHNSVTANLIPEGTFTALCGQGVDWDDQIHFFTRQRSFEKYEPDLDFTMTLKRTGNQIIHEYKHVSLGLAPTIAGEMREADMSEQIFLEY